MRMFWCVTSTYYDDGKCTAWITDCKQAETRPKSTFKSMGRFDIWNDWFDKKDRAIVFAETCRSS